MDGLRAGAMLMALIEKQNPPLPPAHFAGNQHEGLQVKFQVWADNPTEHEAPAVIRDRLSAILGTPDEHDTRDGNPYDPAQHMDTYDRTYSTHRWHWGEITVLLTSYRAWWEVQK